MRPLSPSLAAGALLFVAGCNTDMWRQPRVQAYNPSEFYPDGQASRPLVPGTIAQGKLRADGAYFTGVRGGKFVTEFPFPITRAVLDRGQERFDIYCSPCHGRLGNGQGMIAHRGFALKRPVGNYHTDRLRKMPIGHFYDVITNGYGAMFSYASRVEPQDRWAIVAYIRALQLSQNATPADVPTETMTQLRALKPGDEKLTILREASATTTPLGAAGPGGAPTGGAE